MEEEKKKFSGAPHHELHEHVNPHLHHSEVPEGTYHPDPKHAETAKTSLYMLKVARSPLTGALLSILMTSKNICSSLLTKL